MLSGMETHGALDPTDAAGQLAGWRADRERLAERVVPPWWYDPALGVVVFLLVSALSLRDAGWWYFGDLAVGIVGLGVLVHTYRRITGVWVSISSDNIFLQQEPHLGVMNQNCIEHCLLGSDFTESPIDHLCCRGSPIIHAKAGFFLESHSNGIGGIGLQRTVNNDFAAFFLSGFDKFRFLRKNRSCRKKNNPNYNEPQRPDHEFPLFVP